MGIKPSKPSYRVISRYIVLSINALSTLSVDATQEWPMIKDLERRMGGTPMPRNALPHRRRSRVPLWHGHLARAGPRAHGRDAHATGIWAVRDPVVPPAVSVSNGPCWAARGAVARSRRTQAVKPVFHFFGWTCPAGSWTLGFRPRPQGVDVRSSSRLVGVGE